MKNIRKSRDNSCEKSEIGATKRVIDLELVLIRRRDTALLFFNTLSS